MNCWAALLRTYVTMKDIKYFHAYRHDFLSGRIVDPTGVLSSYFDEKKHQFKSFLFDPEPMKLGFYVRCRECMICCRFRCGAKYHNHANDHLL